ncbi:alpha/beta hydrolase [Clostridium lacusfryxellense]|uniref:alpha/beta hydrolase n=1 Tax=Clostridium lacusfryxellense TaxID=205328 RepID=UPI001C0C8608|nr:alpha/beta hydrolase [Clostridium lacusfryxellense]MBU3110153.1 alpha/beta hydrolase [Clostridium lacusfryxellense]
MIKPKRMLSVATMILITTMSITMITGCQNKTTTVPTTTTTTEKTGTANADQMKTNNENVVKELITAGTITKDQGDKILAKLTGGMKAGMDNGGPLASLVTDKTITQEQADAVMAKLFGGMKGGNGGGMSSLDTSAIKTKYLDVAYASKSSTEKLDIYLPNSGTGPFPVIVAIHGGAFKSGDKASGETAPMLAALERGYAVVAVNYRLSEEAQFPAQINDIKAAIRFVKANASKYNLNESKIATWGGSAGGSLSSLAGTSGGVETLEGAELGNSDKSSNVQAVVDWFGPIYFSTMDAEFAKLGVTPAMGTTSSATSPESSYIGKTIGTAEAEELVKKASPQTYISNDDPAFFIQHGTVDKNIPITQSENFASKLKAVIGDSKVTFEKIVGASHGGAQFETTENVNKVLDFLDKYLK